MIFPRLCGQLRQKVSLSHRKHRIRDLFVCGGLRRAPRPNSPELEKAASPALMRFPSASACRNDDQGRSRPKVLALPAIARLSIKLGLRYDGADFREPATRDECEAGADVNSDHDDLLRIDAGLP
jgi:hypothetical protein